MTSFRLKILAIVVMTIDHAAKIIGQAGLMMLFPSAPLSLTYWIVNLMQGIGRLAFPLFAFMIAEGCRKTRSMPRYIGRLALFALISEPFFYFAFHGASASVNGFLAGLLHIRLTNVFFTLTLGAVSVYIYQLLESKKSKKLVWLFLPIFVAIILISGAVDCDYGMPGVVLIVALYFAQPKKWKAAVIAVWAVGLYILYQASVGMNWAQVSVFSVINCICASLSVVFILLYNGKRGRPLKWSFYIYYPAHLFLFSLIGFALQP